MRRRGGNRHAAPSRSRSRLPSRAAKTEPASITCPENLGTGVRHPVGYCFVLAGRDPAQGVIVAIPPHTGEATLRFNLHNRHTYRRADEGRPRVREYTAVIGALTLKGEPQLIHRAAIQTEFRTAKDLHDRITGGAGPGGVKAVAPVGAEAISLAIPAGVDQVSLLGEYLEAVTAAGRESASPGRPVAIVSNVMIEYRPKR